MDDNTQVGYDPDFIGDGISVPLPKFSRSLAQSVLRKPDVLRDGIYSDHIHFTLVMNEHTRQLIYAAYNIDQSKFIEKVPGKGKRGWKNDKSVGDDNQLDNEYYKDRKNSNGEKIPNPYDRGHMVMRFNNMWGETKNEVDKAGKATFIYSNSSLQHENLNRDEWKELELNVVRTFNHDANDKLSVFQGPIWGDLDRHINLTDNDSARVPSGFFKIICYRTKLSEPGKQLGVLAFAIFQDDQVLRDKKGASTVKVDQRYQVTISEIQNWTGINFGEVIYNNNPLFYHNIKERNSRFNISTIPERIPFGPGKDIITHFEQKRSDVMHLAKRQIVINSAMINPENTPERNGEWISLHNRGNNIIVIDGWKLVDGKGRDVTLNGGINSGESLKLDKEKKGKIQLSNSGGGLMLFDEHGCLIDSVTWSKQQIDRMEENIAFVFNSSF